MDRKSILIFSATVLATLLEEESKGMGFIPRSTVYMLVGQDFNASETLEGMLKSAGLVTVTTETIRLTDAGREKAKELEEILKNH